MFSELRDAHAWPEGINKSLQEEVGKRKPVCERVGSQRAGEEAGSRW